MHTLVIPFAAHNVNLRSSLHVVGTPAATAISGFGHAALRLIAEITRQSFVDRGSALVIKSYDMLPGRSKARLAMRDDAGKARAGTEAGMFDERLGIITGSFVIRFEASSGALFQLEEHLIEVKDALHTLGFSGGVLQVTDKLKINANDDNGLIAFKQLPGHHRVLVDRTEMLTTYAEAMEVDHLDALAQLLILSQEQLKAWGQSQVAKKSVGEKAVQEAEASEDDIPYLGRLVPMSIGYRAIELARLRNTGMPYLHVYAEPVTGLARLQALSSYIRSEEGISAFWAHSHNDRAYISKGEI
ncbi:hypothetical protein DV532_26440 (plasmid) [Pseudomonas sp. Leaf58]|uniref:type I-F CRISPR-associated protein Csy2 n=1 Tax=Pseudomonas sp. Leaf58 TaxID=1736226 RepID=UPI0006F5D70E|nr:type I-F CRISPR-associated protein Csy2 [Pseudomonas sp. Leaf58]AYG47825.1 hypothetical protein DV532_26440 [Pseudomonas sp. Leaf58]KQN62608.1 hypothetical protein ASF02_10705 [Pseudomonas sp. Leaf58]